MVLLARPALAVLEAILVPKVREGLLARRVEMGLSAPPVPLDLLGRQEIREIPVQTVPLAPRESVGFLGRKGSLARRSLLSVRYLDQKVIAARLALLGRKETRGPPGRGVQMALAVLEAMLVRWVLSDPGENVVRRVREDCPVL